MSINFKADKLLLISDWYVEIEHFPKIAISRYNNIKLTGNFFLLNI